MRPAAAHVRFRQARRKNRDRLRLCEAPGGPLCGKRCCPFSKAKIIVRRPLPGETIEAIDRKSYVLGPEMCMICDAHRPVAIGGVMGGAQTEISLSTREVLIEAAESIRSRSAIPLAN